MGCDELADVLGEMIVDDQRDNVLTKYTRHKGKLKKIESDHNSLFAKFDLEYCITESDVRREIFNFKSKEAQEKFKEVTNTSTRFRSCFDPKRTINENINKF